LGFTKQVITACRKITLGGGALTAGNVPKAAWLRRTDSPIHATPHKQTHQHTQRNVDPYGLAYRGGCWYLVGYCHLRQALRTFRLDRVHSVAVSPAHFTPPVDFDVLHHIAHGVASLPRAFKVEVILKTDMATAQAAVLDTIGLLQPHARGVLMQVHADDLNWVARALAGLPFDFEIALQGLAKRLLAAVDL
jgi:predicted DNA-binding transcriptional regulator YafY